MRRPVARQHGQPARAVQTPVRAAPRAGRSPAPGPRPCRPRASADRPGPRRRGRGPRRRPVDRSRRAAPGPVRAARTAVATANTDAPAPPRPPTTASTAPSPPPPSAACASAATSQGSASGREITCSAPTATACFHASGGGSPETATTTPAPPRQPGVRARPGGGRVEHDDRRARPAPASLGGVEGAHDLASGRRGRPQHRVEQIRVGHHHQPAPAARPVPSPVVACSPCRRPRICAPPRRPARCGPHVKPGVAEAVRTDELLRCGWRESDVDNWRVPAGRPRRGCRCGAARMEVPCLRVPSTLRNRSARRPLRRTGTGCAVREGRSARGGRTGRPPSGGIDGGRRRFSSGGLS